MYVRYSSVGKYMGKHEIPENSIKNHLTWTKLVFIRHMNLTELCSFYDMQDITCIQQQ